jgi:hypothetical protein
MFANSGGKLKCTCGAAGIFWQLLVLGDRGEVAEAKI